ncbi:hypothetical protein DFH09DRAFT_1492486, partial [Mycena vulgaris]
YSRCHCPDVAIASRSPSATCCRAASRASGPNTCMIFFCFSVRRRAGLFPIAESAVRRGVVGGVRNGSHGVGGGARKPLVTAASSLTTSWAASNPFSASSNPFSACAMGRKNAPSRMVRRLPRAVVAARRGGDERRGAVAKGPCARCLVDLGLNFFTSVRSCGMGKPRRFVGLGGHDATASASRDCMRTTGARGSYSVGNADSVGSVKSGVKMENMGMSSNMDVDRW